MTNINVYLFVYGTLRKGLSSPMSVRLAQAADYIAEGYLQAQLYDVGGYPGAVPSSVAAERVKGDVYRLYRPKETFILLDDYEECTAGHKQPHEYIREMVDIVLPDASTVTAWSYLYNRSAETLAPILSGDYLSFLKRKLN
ncbi:MAG: gamma-glutamylcyclotransferase family protein [Gammaproteobacteria bacterium]